MAFGKLFKKRSSGAKTQKEVDEDLEDGLEDESRSEDDEDDEDDDAGPLSLAGAATGATDKAKQGEDEKESEAEEDADAEETDGGAAAAPERGSNKEGNKNTDAFVDMFRQEAVAEPSIAGLLESAGEEAAASDLLKEARVLLQAFYLSEQR